MTLARHTSMTYQVSDSTNCRQIATHRQLEHRKVNPDTPTITVLSGLSNSAIFGSSRFANNDDCPQFQRHQTQRPFNHISLFSALDYRLFLELCEMTVFYNIAFRPQGSYLDEKPCHIQRGVNLWETGGFEYTDQRWGRNVMLCKTIISHNNRKTR